MVAGDWDGAENGMADIDDEHGANFATEEVEVGDIEADILTSNGLIEVMGHGSPPLFVRLAVETVDRTLASLPGAIHGMTAFATQMPQAGNCCSLFSQGLSVRGFSEDPCVP